jgi:DNA-binding transcriptional regulator GbsR (MarR family)
VVAEMSTGSDPSEVDRFVERFALNLVEAGLPRMPARVFAALLVSESGKLTATQLATQLHVSPAAISGAVRYLLQVRMIERGRDPGERRDHYALPAGLWYEAVTRRDAVLVQWIKAMEEGMAVVGQGSAAAARLEESRDFFQFLHNELPAVFERWRVQRTAASES